MFRYRLSPETFGYTLVYARETRSLTLREENRLRAFEKKVLRKIFQRNGEEVTGGWRKNYIMRNFIICIHHVISLGRLSKG
jgi:hypothetical protein